MHNFRQRLEAPLPLKQNTFSRFFIAFLKCASNLENFQQKDANPSLIFPKLIDSEKGGYLKI